MTSGGAGAPAQTNDDGRAAVHAFAEQIDEWLTEQYAPAMYWHLSDIAHTAAGCVWDDDAGEDGAYDCELAFVTSSGGPLDLDTRTLTVDVAGVPAPQGSKSYKGMRAGKPILAESSKKVAPWRAQVETAARARMRLTGTATFTGPVIGEAWFWLPRPQSMPRDRIVDGIAYPTAYPDLSKLIRSTEDALKTAGVVYDDAQFTDWILHKRYETNGTTGARITIEAIDPIEGPTS